MEWIGSIVLRKAWSTLLRLGRSCSRKEVGTRVTECVERVDPVASVMDPMARFFEREWDERAGSIEGGLELPVIDVGGRRDSSEQEYRGRTGCGSTICWKITVDGREMWVSELGNFEGGRVPKS